MGRLDDKTLEAIKPGSTKLPEIPAGMSRDRRD